MSSEQRDIRPVGSVSAFDDLLNGSSLLVGDQRYDHDERVILEEISFLNSPVAIDLGGHDKVVEALAAAKAELDSLDLELDHLEFAVILSSSYLRILEFRHKMPLAQLASTANPLILSSGKRPDALRAPRSGCTIELTIHLAQQRPRQPLKPWRVGSWISRASWALTTDLAFTGFTPKPLTAEKKKEMSLPQRATRYITLTSSPLDPDVNEDSVELWFDADLLAKISANPRTKLAVALQRQLFVDAVAAVVNHSRHLDGFASLAWADVKDTLLGRVVSVVGPNHSNEAARDLACTGFLEDLKSDPARFMTLVEDAAGLTAAYEAGLDG